MSNDYVKSFFSQETSPSNWALNQAEILSEREQEFSAYGLIVASTFLSLPSSAKEFACAIVKVAVATFSLTLGQIPAVKSRTWRHLEDMNLVSTSAGATLAVIALHVYRCAMFLTFSPLCCIFVGLHSPKACKTAHDWVGLTTPRIKIAGEKSGDFQEETTASDLETQEESVSSKKSPIKFAGQDNAKEQAGKSEKIEEKKQEPIQLKFRLPPLPAKKGRNSEQIKDTGRDIQAISDISKAADSKEQMTSDEAKAKIPPPPPPRIISKPTPTHPHADELPVAPPRTIKPSSHLAQLSEFSVAPIPAAKASAQKPSPIKRPLPTPPVSKKETSTISTEPPKPPPPPAAPPRFSNTAADKANNGEKTGAIKSLSDEIREFKKEQLASATVQITPSDVKPKEDAKPLPAENLFSKAKDKEKQRPDSGTFSTWDAEPKASDSTQESKAAPVLKPAIKQPEASPSPKHTATPLRPKLSKGVQFKDTVTVEEKSPKVSAKNDSKSGDAKVETLHEEDAKADSAKENVEAETTELTKEERALLLRRALIKKRKGHADTVHIKRLDQELDVTERQLNVLQQKKSASTILDSEFFKDPNEGNKENSEITQ